MKLIDKILYLEINDAVACGLGSAEYISKERSRGAKWGQFIDDPEDRRKLLINYKSLKPAKKELVEKRYGNVYEQVALEPLRRMVTRDVKAYDYYLQYRFAETKSLPIEYVEKYTVAASWLNMLVTAKNDKRAIKKLFNLRLSEFWLNVSKVIHTDKIDLPVNSRRLQEKVDQYKEGGYESLISKHFCNTRTKKISDEIAEAMLLEMVNNHNQYDDVWVALAYSEWAQKNGYKSIHPATVGNWRRDNAHLITANREGNSISNERFTRQVKGYRPTQPLYMVEHDDNNLDFLFRDPNDRTPHKYFHRYVAICVTDSCCDLLLGKCYTEGKTPESWMVKVAYIDAMYYIRKLTGAWHLPFEIKADRWRKAELVPFYEKIAKFIMPAKGNKHRGYIEQFFGSHLWKRAQKIGNNNWSGNNMSAVNRGVNKELLEANQAVRATVGQEAEQQIENFFHRLRHMPDVTRANMSARSKEEQWLAMWNKLPADKKIKISDEQFLSIFGFEHNPNNSIKITNRGIEPQISGCKYSYDLPQGTSFTRLIGAKVNVIYDPYDMRRVLITNNDDIRFIASSATLQPRALEDQYAGSRTQLNEALRAKKMQIMAVVNAADKRRTVLQRNSFDAEAVLQAGVMTKELKNAAEYEYYLAASNNTDEDYDPLDVW